jgi:hypothetical protein
MFKLIFVCNEINIVIALLYSSWNQICTLVILNTIWKIVKKKIVFQYFLMEPFHIFKIFCLQKTQYHGNKRVFFSKVSDCLLAPEISIKLNTILYWMGKFCLIENQSCDQTYLL